MRSSKRSAKQKHRTLISSCTQPFVVETRCANWRLFARKLDMV